ncbi:HNH endonuclease [Streptomyces canus]|uniref:HNH endonuclease n=1 Tax=Streptomyces canus TaxID=58343 RepID=UPI0036E43580
MASTKDAGRRGLLLAASNDVEAAGAHFRQAAQAGRLHELLGVEFTLPGVQADEAVQWVYTNGMVNTRTGRVIYDQLMAAPEDERCPLCGHGMVRSLDHYLPKRMFPALCVDPLNLVPACADCNHAKGETTPGLARTTPLHPYLDNIDNDSWLDARIAGTAPVWLEFYVNPPPTWDALLADRARYHFDLFGLASLFSTQANRTLSGIRRQLMSVFAAGGEDQVRAYLAEEATTRLVHRPNGWEGVTYRTLAEDDAFCRGPFAL